MIKKIDVHDLGLNMYIHDLNCDWMEHTFLHNNFLVKDAQEIEKIIAAGIRHVYIDTGRGQDVPQAPSAEQVRRQLDSNIQNLGHSLRRSAPHQISIEEELVQARRIFSDANALVTSISKDARLGKQLDLGKIEPVIAAIASSIYRNPDAMLSLLRIKKADNSTFQHSVAVCALLIGLCRTQEIDRDTTEQAGMGGILHDIGKMKIPGHILHKLGKLSESECEIMKKHVGYGCLLIENTPNLSPISLQIAAEHHERNNGSGYPRALKGDEISLYGRMAAIVDVYDELTAAKIHHKAREPTEVLKKLLEWGDQYFDTNLVHNFIRTIGIYPVGTLVRLERGYLAIVVKQHPETLLQPKVRLIFNSKSLCYVPPQDLDLSSPRCDDRIVSFETPSRWRINPERFL